jgi:protein-S-isoprenylcysteine O-methyltransferase Ste14
MTAPAHKTKIGAALASVLVGVGLPVVFWFAATSTDRAAGIGPVLSIPASRILAAASILVGLFWVTWSYSYLVFVGKGIPFEAFGWALHPTRILVTTGPYAYTRNPMALGMLFVLLGVAFLARSVTGLVLVPAIAVVFYIYLTEFEEKGLVRRFGNRYVEYRRNVPALIPRLTPYMRRAAA